MSVIHSPAAEDVINVIDTAAKDKFDAVLTTGETTPKITDVGGLCFELGSIPGDVFPTGSAELQYLTRIGVQGQFFHKCSPQLKRNILAEFHKNKSFTFRCGKRPPEQLSHGGTMAGYNYARTVLSPQYPTSRDDNVLYPLVLEALNRPNIRLTRFEQTDHVTELIVSFLDTRVEMNGAVTQGSISITNSETGHSSLWIEPNIQIFNGVWIGNRFGDKVSSRYVHRGELPSVEQLREDIENAKRIVQVGIVQYLEACEQRVATGDAIKYMESLAVLPKRFTAIIAEEIADQERIVKTELIRRILLATQELPLIQSLAVRREVGGYVGLFENTASRLANLVNEIE